LFLFVLAYIAYRYWSLGSAKRAPDPLAPNIEQMLECIHCGIRLPENEAVGREGKVFCSEQHYASWKQNH